jgi:hypothetical protein
VPRAEMDFDEARATYNIDGGQQLLVARTTE